MANLLNTIFEYIKFVPIILYAIAIFAAGKMPWELYAIGVYGQYTSYWQLVEFIFIHSVYLLAIIPSRIKN